MEEGVGSRLCPGTVIHNHQVVSKVCDIWAWFDPGSLFLFSLLSFQTIYVFKKSSDFKTIMVHLSCQYVALLIITAALKPAQVHLPCLLVIKRLHLSPVLSTSDAIQHCAPVQTAHTGSVLIHYSKQPSRSLIFSSTNRLIPHTINLPMSFEGMLTNQMHIQAQWIYSLVAICYGNTSYPQTKPVAEREFFFFFFFFSSHCFFSLISWCYSSVSISVSYSCGSAESEVECTQAWHKHNKGLVFLEKSMSPRWWRLFQVNYNVRCTDHATQRKKSWYADSPFPHFFVNQAWGGGKKLSDTHSCGRGTIDHFRLVCPSVVTWGSPSAPQQLKVILFWCFVGFQSWAWSRCSRLRSRLKEREVVLWQVEREQVLECLCHSRNE